MRIIAASFFWRNDQPDGLGFKLDSSVGWTPEDIEATFTGSTVAEYFRASDELIDEGVVQTYLEQLQAIALEAKAGPLPLTKAILAALNIMYLAERGHLPRDDFNGPMFVQLS